MPEIPPRPTQVTIAAWLVMSGSVVVVVAAFERIAGLRSADTREAVQEFRGTGLGEWLGMDLQGTLTLMRVLTMVAAACATAAAILGFQILRRSRPARLGLTVLAPPLFVGGLVVGGYLPAVIAGSILVLWLQPARDWIDGKAPRVVTEPSPAEPPATAGWPPPASPSPPSSQPRAVPGFGAAPSQASEAWRTIPPAYAAVPARRVRPAALMWACGLAWGGSAIVFALMLLSIAVVLAAPDTLIDEVYRQSPELRSEGLTSATLRSSVLVGGTLLVVCSVVVSVIAAFAWRGRPWAWRALLVSACAATGFCLLSALGSPVMLVPLALCAATIPLLLRPEVRAFVNQG